MAQNGHMPPPHPEATTAVLRAFTHDPSTFLFLFHRIPGTPPLPCRLLAVRAHAANGQWQFAASLLTHVLADVRGSCNIAHPDGPPAVAAVAESLKEAAVATTSSRCQIDVLAVLRASKEVRLRPAAC
jgi:hypothetical protein